MHAIFCCLQFSSKLDFRRNSKQRIRTKSARSDITKSIWLYALRPITFKSSRYVLTDVREGCSSAKMATLRVAVFELFKFSGTLCPPPRPSSVNGGLFLLILMVIWPGLHSTSSSGRQAVQVGSFSRRGAQITYQSLMSRA